ncbi:MAG: HAMP domain-containing histidine kinase, partial [Methanobacteriota archaeon]
MMGFVSHEIRNPAHVIAASTNLLKDLIPPGHAAREDLEAIQHSSEAIHRLVNDIVSYSSLTRGRLEFQWTTVPVRRFIESLAATHRAFAKVPITWRVEPDVPAYLIADRMRLQQILVNGLTNAAKFCTRGQITVRVRCKYSTVGSNDSDAEGAARVRRAASSESSAGGRLAHHKPHSFVQDHESQASSDDDADVTMTSEN